MNNKLKEMIPKEIAHLENFESSVKIAGKEGSGLTKFDFISAKEISSFLGIGKTQAYEICKLINDELAEKGFLTFRGKVPRKALLARLPD